MKRLQEPPAPLSRPKWHRLYFLLAIFDLVTILLSLYLNHRLLAIHGDSVAVNQAWADRLSRLSELGQLAGAVNAPGNDVFDSRDVSRESARLKQEYDTFLASLELVEKELVSAMSVIEFARIGVDLDRVREAMKSMVAEAERIFSHFRDNMPELAGERMATMDRRFAEASGALADVNQQVRQIQSAKFLRQLEVANSLRRFEYLIAGAILLMVVAACLYGQKMAKVMAQSAEEYQALVQQLKFSNEVLEHRVDERTRDLSHMNRNLETEVEERKRAEVELRQAQEKLLESSRLAGMTEVATGVLHNVGNVLNSANVSANLILDRVSKSKVSSMAKGVRMMSDHRDDLASFLTTDAKGRMLPTYFEKATEELEREQTEFLTEMKSLQGNLEHIKQIVAMQQSFAKVSGAVEAVALDELVEDALRMSSAALTRHHIEVRRDYQPTPLVMVDRHKALQILVNLMSNAKQAMDKRAEGRVLMLRVQQAGGTSARIEVQDNGEGIAEENLTRIFQHGFTTKKNGHGFGLHSAANAAKEMGGNLMACSSGPGHGASFVLNLPTKQAIRTSKTVSVKLRGNDDSQLETFPASIPCHAVAHLQTINA